VSEKIIAERATLAANSRHSRTLPAERNRDVDSFACLD